MGTLLRLAMIVGVLVIVFLVLPEGNGPVASTRQQAEQKLAAATEQARRALSDVEVEAIGKELRETGRVVRRRSSHAVRTLAEATEDMRTTAAIEAQYVMDPRLSALTIEVESDGPAPAASSWRLLLANDLAVRIAHWNGGESELQWHATHWMPIPRLPGASET